MKHLLKILFRCYMNFARSWRALLLLAIVEELNALGYFRDGDRLSAIDLSVAVLLLLVVVVMDLRKWWKSEDDDKPRDFNRNTLGW